MAPGFGRSPGLNWLSSVRDLACDYARFLRENGFERVDVLGFSLGGWLAAEMAVNSPGQFARMMLVAPMGIKPSEGEILDLFLRSAPEYLRAGICQPASCAEYLKLYGNQPTQPQLEQWEEARAQVYSMAGYDESDYYGGRAFALVLGVADVDASAEATRRAIVHRVIRATLGAAATLFGGDVSAYRYGEADVALVAPLTDDAARADRLAALLRARLDELLHGMTTSVRAFAGARWVIRVGEATWSDEVVTSGGLLRAAQDALEHDDPLTRAA